MFSNCSGLHFYFLIWTFTYISNIGFQRAFKVSGAVFCFYFSSTLHSYPFVETRNQNKTHHHSSIGKPRVSPLLSLNTESAEVATSASFIRGAGKIRNKYRPVTDFVRVVSVCLRRWHSLQTDSKIPVNWFVYILPLVAICTLYRWRSTIQSNTGVSWNFASSCV